MLAWTQLQKECACSTGFDKELLVIPARVEFGEERTEHRSTLFGTDIDVIQLENFLIEFVLTEKSEG